MKEGKIIEYLENEILYVILKRRNQYSLKNLKHLLSNTI